MIQFREKAGRTDRQTDGRKDGTEFIRPHYHGSKKGFHTTVQAKLEEAFIYIIHKPMDFYID